MRQPMLWREKGCVLSYVLDASLFLLRRAIASRGKPVLSCWQCRAMFNSCLTSRDWSRRQYNDSASSIYSSTMREAFRACNSPTWTCEVAPNIRGETTQLHPGDARGRTLYAESRLGADYKYRR